MLKKMKKMIRNPHADPDHRLKAIISRGSCFAHACQVSSTSVFAFVKLSCLQNDTCHIEQQNDHTA